MKVTAYVVDRDAVLARPEVQEHIAFVSAWSPLLQPRVASDVLGRGLLAHFLSSRDKAKERGALAAQAAWLAVVPSQFHRDDFRWDDTYEKLTAAGAVWEIACHGAVGIQSWYTGFQETWELFDRSDLFLDHVLEGELAEEEP